MALLEAMVSGWKGCQWGNLVPVGLETLWCLCSACCRMHIRCLKHVVTLPMTLLTCVALSPLSLGVLPVVDCVFGGSAIQQS